jgi:hypothetical protein
MDTCDRAPWYRLDALSALTIARWLAPLRMKDAGQSALRNDPTGKSARTCPAPFAKIF